MIAVSIYQKRFINCIPCKQLLKKNILLIGLLLFLFSFKSYSNEYVQSPKLLLGNFFNTLSYNFKTGLDKLTVKYFSNDCYLLIKDNEKIIKYCHIKTKNGELLQFDYDNSILTINLIHHHDIKMLDTLTLAVSPVLFQSSFDFSFGGFVFVSFHVSDKDNEFIFNFNNSTMKSVESFEENRYLLVNDFISTSGVVTNYTHMLYKKNPLNPIYYKSNIDGMNEITQNQFNNETMQADKFGMLMLFTNFNFD